MNKVKIGVLTCIWKRHELFKVFAEHWKDLSTKFKNVEFVFIAVGSEGVESRSICDNTVFEYHHHENKPISNKWNYGCQQLKHKNIDAALFLGSDDFICEDTLLKLLQTIFNGYDFVGLQDCYLYNKPTKELVYFQGYRNGRSGETIGIARCLSVELLMALNFSPWGSNLNSRLDASMQGKLKWINYSQESFKCKNFEGFAVDVKTDINITPFSKDLPEANKILLNKIPALNGYL